MAEKWNKRWDGEARPHQTYRERVESAREAALAKEQEHERRLREDRRYRKKWEAKEAKKAGEKAKREAKAQRILRKHGVFDAVVPQGDDGRRHCPRCEGTAFTKRQLRGSEFYQPGGQYIGVAIHLTVGKAHMVCDHCGAAYPLDWATWETLGKRPVPPRHEENLPHPKDKS